MRIRLVVFAAVLVALAVAAPAQALSRKQAEAVALRVLKPEREQRVIVFGLPAPLRASQSVAIASPKRGLGYAKADGLKPVGAKAWVFWEDLRPGAKFEHPSKLLLVSDHDSRHVLRTLTWYPLIDGFLPPWLKSQQAYRNPAYHVFANVTFAKRKPAAAATAATGGSLPPGAFADDCLIMAGLFADPKFRPDFVGMEAFARSVGLRTFYAGERARPYSARPLADRSGANGEDLERNVDWLVDRERCKDIFIFLDGHGSRDGRGSVTTGEDKWIFPADLSIVMGAHPNITFKVKIDACFSGKFLDPANGLKEKPNLLVLETSSSATEVSYSSLDGMEITGPDGEPVVSETPNGGRGEFTNGNIAGMRTFTRSLGEVSAAQEAGGSLLARTIARSFVRGARSDRARQAGWTHPQIYDNIRDTTPPPPPVAVTATPSHTHPAGADSSYLCEKVTVGAGYTLSLSVSGPAGYSQSKTATLPGGTGTKTHTFSFGITSYGPYSFKLTATKGSQSVTKETMYTVGSEQQGPFACPAP